MIALKIIKGPTSVGEHIKLPSGSSLILGRSSEAQYQLKSIGVSKKHCEIRAVPGAKIEITDLGSSNGTFVNGLMIKKQVLKLGDTVTIHDFVLKVEAVAPGPSLSAAGEGFGDFAQTAAPQDSLQKEQKTIENKPNFFERTIFPIADTLAGQGDVRTLVLGFFILWTIAIALLSILPFSQNANLRIEQQAKEVAKLYARQLARINQTFVVEHAYQRLVHNLDEYTGQTPGITNSMIIDASNGQIIAPSEMVGRSITNPETVAGLSFLKKLQDPQGYAKIDARGFVHALAPIRIGVSDPNQGGQLVSKVAAVSYVEMDSTRANLSMADLLDGALTSLLMAIIIGFVFLALVYRWTEGTLVVLNRKTQDLVDEQASSIEINFNWPNIKALADKINTINNRSGGSNLGAGEEKSLEWAMASVELVPIAAAAFDEQLVVVAWNAKMEDVIGIRASMALGNDIGSASRDVAFENAIREMSASAQLEVGIPQRRNLDFGGRDFQISLVFAEGASLVTITPVEEDE